MLQICPIFYNMAYLNPNLKLMEKIKIGVPVRPLFG